MGECCFKRLTHNYDMAIYQSNWQQPKMDCNVYVSNIFKYPEIRQIWCVHWYTAEASAEERGRGAKFMRWDGGGNTFSADVQRLQHLPLSKLNFRCEWHREDTGEAVLSCVWH